MVKSRAATPFSKRQRRSLCLAHLAAIATTAATLAVALLLVGTLKRAIPDPPPSGISSEIPTKDLWRSAQQVVTNGIGLPILFFFAWRHHGFDLQRWSRHAAETSDGAWNLLFLYFFPAHMSLDFVLMEITGRPLIMMHHVACVGCALITPYAGMRLVASFIFIIFGPIPPLKFN